MGTKEIICQFYTLGETVATSIDFKADPYIACVVGEVILVDKFLWDILKLDLHIFWSIHWGCEVETLDVEACKLCVST